MIDMYMDQRGKIMGREIKYLGKCVEIIFRVLRRKSSRNTEGKCQGCLKCQLEFSLQKVTMEREWQFATKNDVN